MIEIKFRGRGGQGAVSASEILGRALFLDGKYPQCFSLFGGERRGAPVVGFLRVDEEPILLKCQIYHPDHIIIFDPSLINEDEILQELKPGGMVLVNINEEMDFLQSLRKFKIGFVNASLIAKDTGVGSTLNTVMLGAYIHLTNLVKMDTLVEAVKTMVPSKMEENIQAVKEGYRQVKIFEVEE
ncbi:MAG: 2-oxoacid:acceptor oxidoreductase family protein [Syntrophaceae bacterium]|nr:2-oxoacid:acceptor oxidoreductase family protein [Syntrophaceae bacterium]